MKIEIHSIRSIEKRAKLPFAPNTILISMGDTGAEPPRLKNNPDHILRLTFDDISIDIEYLRADNINIFSDEQARQIAEFVLKHKSSADVLICQCHFGQSRSAGCAAAILEYLYGNGASVFNDYRFYPNRLVYQKVLGAFEKCESASQEKGLLSQ